MTQVYRFVKSSIFIALIVFIGALSAFGQVNVTGGTGGNALCVGAGYTTLDPIVFTETLNGDISISNGGAPMYFYLDRSDPNFEFNPGVGSVSFTGGGSGSVLASITVTSSRIAIAILEGDNSNNSNINVLTISGIQVRATGVASGQTITHVDATPLANLAVNNFALGSNVTSCVLTSTVSPAPAISGLTSVCADQVGVTYTTASAGPTYDWTVTGAASFTGDGTNTITVTWGSVNGTVQLQETNASLCSTTTPLYNVTVIPNPVAYNVTGGGTYCAGGSGMTVGLDDSDTGISYQLLFGGSPVGTPVSGTGSAIDFGLQTADGNYTVEASTISNPVCGPVAMTGTVSVTVRALPVVQIVSAPGSTSYCAGSPNVTVNLNSSESGYSYELYKDGLASGTIEAGTGSSLSYTGLDAGVYTVYGFYTTAPSCITQMSGSVTVIQTADPVAYNVTGGGTYCAGGSGMTVGLDDSDTGISYQLLFGGSPVGTPVSGTGSAIDFGLQTADGNYTVEASTVSVPVCGPVLMNSSAAVSINPIPVFSIANTTPVLCEGIASNITLTSPTTGAVITLTAVNYNGVTGSTDYAGGETFTDGDQITESYSNPGDTPLTVTYTFSVAANGCGNAVTQQTTVIVNPDPVFGITNITPTICEGVAANITLTSPTTNAVITLVSVDYDGGSGGETLYMQAERPLYQARRLPRYSASTIVQQSNGCTDHGNV